MTYAKPLIEKLNILNVYQFNIIQTTTFMLTIRLNLTTNVFFKFKLKRIKHKYPATYAVNNFVMPQKQLKILKYAILGPKL